MWPLLACSVIGLAVMIERGIYFLRLRLNYDVFTKNLKTLLSQKKFREASQYCRSSSNPVAFMAFLYLKHLHNNTLREEVIKREGSLALEKLEANLRGLAAITHIAPLLGLLGTVTGLVSAFHAIEVLGGQAQPSDLAAGIWEALITTVFGLMIAIPCMAAYHGYEGIADHIARRMEFIVSELDEFFGKQSRSQFTPQDAEAIEGEMNTIQ